MKINLKYKVVVNMQIGQKYIAEIVVDKTNIATAVGSGNVEVFSTPMMIALMENAASKCVEADLKEGYTTVGGHISTSHISATPIGCRVEATAQITYFDEKKVEFKVSASDHAGIIGEGTHTRFIINSEKFMMKTAQKSVK